MSQKVFIRDNQGNGQYLTARGLHSGTALDAHPTVVVVVQSSVGGSAGAYLGHLELSPENANILGEELRKAAEAASKTNNKEDA